MTIEGIPPWLINHCLLIRDWHYKVPAICFFKVWLDWCLVIDRGRGHGKWDAIEEGNGSQVSNVSVPPWSSFWNLVNQLSNPLAISKLSKNWFYKLLFWLVVWIIFHFSIYWEFHNPNRGSLIFFRGVGLNHQPDDIQIIFGWYSHHISRW